MLAFHHFVPTFRLHYEEKHFDLANEINSSHTNKPTPACVSTVPCLMSAVRHEMRENFQDSCCRLQQLVSWKQSSNTEDWAILKVERDVFFLPHPSGRYVFSPFIFIGQNFLLLCLRFPLLPPIFSSSRGVFVSVVTRSSMRIDVFVFS